MLANNLKNLRQKYSMSMIDLSEISGISTGRISDIENEKNINPSMNTLIRLADALDVSLDELVGRKRIK